ncbi:MAG: sigma 54-interacting transcriptional regulator, partial [Candidatus Lokiarchaeota archaeon]|nr:sigma 54-interacting transcriptional regulator [Candidatus Lokiarchaeota archaeon]
MIRQHHLYKNKINSLNSIHSLENIIGYTDIKKRAISLAKYEVDILIMGETGVGKEILGYAIHNLSLRRRNRFVHIDCAT